MRAFSTDFVICSKSTFSLCSYLICFILLNSSLFCFICSGLYSKSSSFCLTFGNVRNREIAGDGQARDARGEVS